MERLERITLKQMITDAKYFGLSDGLKQLPLPEKLKIKRKSYDIPEDLETFSDSICYGQRLFLSEEETNDFGAILRMIDGYYYPIVTKMLWNENNALLFGKLVLTLSVIHLYPVAMHLITLMADLISREIKLLHREPTKQERAAGIDKLAIFTDLSALDFLRQSLNKTEEEVLLTPYNDCLVRFMLAKEQNAYMERLNKVYQDEAKSKKT